MNIKIIKPIRLTGIGVKQIGEEIEIEDNLADILIRRKFAVEVKEESKRRKKS